MGKVDFSYKQIVNPERVYVFKIGDRLFVDEELGPALSAQSFRLEGTDDVSSVVGEFVSPFRSRELQKAAAEKAVKEERERIAVLLDALVAKAESEETYAGRQSYANCGATHGVGSYDLEELAKSLRGEP